MSQAHLNGFLADVETINPGFRESTSSLRRLVAHLRQTAGVPRAMSLADALRLCTLGGRTGRTEKYKPALENLVTVWGKGSRPYPQLRAGPRLARVDVNRICFRGDDRPPTEIFGRGFTKRKEGAAATYEGYEVRNTSFQSTHDPVRSPISGTSKAGDLDPDSAVCVTPDMNIASLFPLPTKPERLARASWVYLVYVTQGFNTNGRQVLDALAGLAELHEFEKTEPAGAIPKAQLHQVRIRDIVQNLYGREMAADSIPGSSVLGAFKVMRSWATMKTNKEWDKATQSWKRIPSSADYKDGGSYQILEWVPNDRANWPSDAHRMVIAEFVGKMKPDFNSKAFPLPTSDSGYVPSLQK